MENIKPSDVSDIHPSMGLGDYNAEKVAVWIARLLAETGDVWRRMEWDEVEPLLPKDEEQNKRMLKMYFIHLDSEEKAKRIWSIALRYHESRTKNPRSAHAGRGFCF